MGIKIIMDMNHLFEPEIDKYEYEERLMALHRQAFSAKEYDFSKVMHCIYSPPSGYCSHQPQLIYDGDAWHLFYVTGKIEYADVWLQNYKIGNILAALKQPYEEVGDGHAVGDTLFNLQYHGRIMTEAQGEFSSLLQGNGHTVKYGDKWVCVISNRGPAGQSMGLAYSPDLFEWTPDPGNPFWAPPFYATKGKCAGGFIVQYKSRFLIFYMLTSALPVNGVALLSTADFRSFEDHGLVYIAPTQLRGTAVVESPCVVYRNGLWHLFYGIGTGLWHTVSDRPDNFMGQTDLQRGIFSGAYCMGPFHDARVVQTPEGKWYMCSTRKEEQRRMHRDKGISAFRGSKEDEASLQDGIFLAEIEWEGDFPVLKEWQ